MEQRRKELLEQVAEPVGRFMFLLCSLFAFVCSLYGAMVGVIPFYVLMV